jgi:hypothetical protein
LAAQSQSITHQIQPKSIEKSGFNLPLGQLRDKGFTPVACGVNMRFNYVKLKYTFLGIFLLGAAGLVAYDLLIAKPRRACEAAQNWWNDKDRRCYIPVEITSITKRPKAQDAASAPPEPATHNTSSRP